VSLGIATLRETPVADTGLERTLAALALRDDVREER
jgi:hypothetical protein